MNTFLDTMYSETPDTDSFKATFTQGIMDHLEPKHVKNLHMSCKAYTFRELQSHAVNMILAKIGEGSLKGDKPSENLLKSFRHSEVVNMGNRDNQLSKQGHCETDYILVQQYTNKVKIYMGVRYPRRYIAKIMQSCKTLKRVAAETGRIKVYRIPFTSYNAVMDAILLTLKGDEKKCKTIREHLNLAKSLKRKRV